MSLPDPVSWILQWMKLRREVPNINFHLTEASYVIFDKTVTSDKKNSITFNVNLLLENKGNASGSITDIVLRIRYSEKVLKEYPFMKNLIEDYVVSTRPDNIREIIPAELGPFGSKRMNLIFKFSDVIPVLLERGGVTINLRKPKNWTWDDLPIHVQITVVCTNKTLNSDLLICRDDLPESKEIRGPLDPLKEFDLDMKFMPKIKEND